MGTEQSAELLKLNSWAKLLTIFSDARVRKETVLKIISDASYWHIARFFDAFHIFLQVKMSGKFSHRFKSYYTGLSK